MSIYSITLTAVLMTVGTLLIYLSFTEKPFANHMILLVGIAMDITGGVKVEMTAYQIHLEKKELK